VSLERGPLSLVSTTEELLEWESSGSGSRKPRLTDVGIRCAEHAVIGIVLLRTKATEFSLVLGLLLLRRIIPPEL
jgi:hypothetical protein